MPCDLNLLFLDPQNKRFPKLPLFTGNRSLPNNILSLQRLHSFGYIITAPISSDFTALYKCYFIVIIYYYTFMVHMIALIFRSGLVATRQLKLQVMCALQLA